jgi:AdoMet-dependent rRNA methyltransferase SPB1
LVYQNFITYLTLSKRSSPIMAPGGNSKKKKVGKDRQDKYYQLAKDQGYRARSAFKLIQLCKKENFLKDAHVVVDLCGAPGGWSQVAAKHMADGKNNKVVCVDIVPLQPMPGVVGIQCDITTPKCRVVLRKALENR